MIYNDSKLNEMTYLEWMREREERTEQTSSSQGRHDDGGAGGDSEQ